MNRAVLLIEDDPLYRASIKLNFEGETYEFFEAGSSRSGIEVLKTNPEIRVVVLDLQLGAEKGTSVLDFVRTRQEEYRIIVLTGHDELLAAEQAGEYKVFHYLPKAERSAAQSIRFTVDAAFRDLEREHLVYKTQSILKIDTCINENRPLSYTLDLICQCVLEVVGGYTCHVRVYDFKKGDFHLQGFAGIADSFRSVFAEPRAKGDLFSGEVVSTGKPQTYSDLQALDSFRALKSRAYQKGAPTNEESRYWQRVRSALIMPITTGLYEKQVDAVLNISSDRLAYFDSKRQDAVNEFVVLATLAITKDWLRKKRTEAHEDYGAISNMLGEMSGELSNGADLAGVFTVVTRKITKLIRPELVSIFLFDEARARVMNVAELRGSEPNLELDESYSPGESLTGSVFLGGETIHLPSSYDASSNSPLEDERYNRADEFIDRQRLPSGDIRHYLGVPILVDSKPRGVLRAVNKKSAYYDDPTPTSGVHCLLERGFSVDCRNVLEITASHLAVAIRNADLFREKEIQVEQVRTLGEVGRILNSALDIREVLKLTIGEMARVMQAEICMLFLRDGEDRVILEESFGMPRIAGASYRLGEGVTGKVALDGEPQLLVDRVGRNDGKYDLEICRFLTERHGVVREIESLMVAPITAKSTILGALKVINKKGDHLQYTESDLRFFKTFADYVGVAIENAQTYKNLSLLVSAVAHEINNTSGVIPANAFGIRSYFLELDPEIDQMLRVIEEAARQATAFANEIAGFSAKGMEGKQELDLNRIVRVTIDTLASAADQGRSPVKLDMRLSDEPLICEVYERPFAQIVRNIVINAFQAMGGQPGSLIVSTAKAERAGSRYATVSFEDQGPGIRPEHRSKIFEAEFTTKSKGNGLGLWLVRTNLRSVGGTIEVESEVGRGTCFTVSIPLTKPISGAE